MQYFADAISSVCAAGRPASGCMAAFSSGSKSARRGARSNMGGHPSSGVAGKAGAYSSRDPQSLGRPDPCSLPLVAGRRFGSPFLGTEEHQPDLTDEVLLKLARQLRLEIGRTQV